MSLDAGDSGCTHGLSKRIHDAMLSGATGAQDGAALKAFCFAIATAVVAEVTANAAVAGANFNDSTGHACSGSSGVT